MTCTAWGIAAALAAGVFFGLALGAAWRIWIESADDWGDLVDDRDEHETQNEGRS